MFSINFIIYPRTSPRSSSSCTHVEDERASNGNTQQCNCENHELQPQSEYDVAGEWVTYTGDVNLAIFQQASCSAAADLRRQMRAYTNPGAAPRPRQPPADPTPSSSSGSPGLPFEIIDEWAAVSAELAAMQAMDDARRAVDHAIEVNRKAVQAKLTGAHKAKRLERRARFAVQRARDVEEDAKRLVRNAERIAQMYAPSGEPAVKTLIFLKKKEENVEADDVEALAERLAARGASVNDEGAQE